MVTGLLVEGPLIGLAMIIAFLSFIISAIWLVLKKGVLNTIVVLVVSLTFSGILPVLVSSFFSVPLFVLLLLGVCSYFLGLFISLFMLKKQNNRIVIQKSSLGDGSELVDSAFEDDENF